MDEVHNIKLDSNWRSNEFSFRERERERERDDWSSFDFHVIIKASLSQPSLKIQSKPTQIFGFIGFVILMSWMYSPMP